MFFINYVRWFFGLLLISSSANASNANLHNGYVDALLSRDCIVLVVKVHDPGSDGDIVLKDGSLMRSNPGYLDVVSKVVSTLPMLVQLRLCGDASGIGNAVFVPRYVSIGMPRNQPLFIAPMGSRWVLFLQNPYKTSVRRGRIPWIMEYDGVGSELLGENSLFALYNNNTLFAINLYWPEVGNYRVNRPPPTPVFDDLELSDFKKLALFICKFRESDSVDMNELPGLREAMQTEFGIEFLELALKNWFYGRAG